jgi:hypothetical protein
MHLPRLQTAYCGLSKPSFCQRKTRPGKWSGILTVILCLTVAATGTAVADYWLQLSDPKNAMAALQNNPMALLQQKDAMAKLNGIANKVKQNCPLRLVGTTALDFTLPNALTGQKVHLGDLLRKKPVVLLFGSFG